MLLALVCLHHAFRADLLNEIVPHIRQRGVPIQPGFMLHFNDGVLYQFLLVLTQRQRVKEILLALNQLHGAEPAGNIDPLRVILDDMAHRVNAAVNRAVRAEILHFGPYLLCSYLNQRVHQLGNALIFYR